MLFAIDIDGTIAGGSDAYKLYIEHHNNDLGLALSSQQLETLTDYQSFLKLPQVRAYRREHEERFQASRASCRTSTHVILSLKTLPDAVTGVQYLAKLGHICYYTIRSNQNATKQWLETHQFPNPQNVVFCDNALHKLLTIHEQEIQVHEQIMLIDDRWVGLTQTFKELIITHPNIAEEIRQHLILIAFGIDSSPEIQITDLPVFALPSWKDVKKLALQFSLKGEYRVR